MKMTVKELIEKLSKFDSKLPVWIDVGEFISEEIEIEESFFNSPSNRFLTIKLTKDDMALIDEKSRDLSLSLKRNRKALNILNGNCDQELS